MAPRVRNNAVRLASGATICIEKTIKIHVFHSLPQKTKTGFLLFIARSGPGPKARRVRQKSLMDQRGSESRCELLRSRRDQSLRKFGEPLKIRRLPLGYKPELLDAGFESRRLDIEKL